MKARCQWARLTSKIEDGERALAVHEAKPCPEVAEHERDKHDRR